MIVGESLCPRRKRKNFTYGYLPFPRSRERPFKSEENQMEDKLCCLMNEKASKRVLPLLEASQRHLLVPPLYHPTPQKTQGKIMILLAMETL
jgi:hypothetical protein